MTLDVRATALAEVYLITPPVFTDERGFFSECWNQLSYSQIGVSSPFVQVNRSHSKPGVLRGLHYQLPQAQGKLVMVLSGEIFDVAVDVRRNSPSFGHWVGVTLSASNRSQLWIPAGFAHGFYVPEQAADVVYFCTAPYAPAAEQTLRWDDPTVAIDWPLRHAPVISAKDQQGVRLEQARLFEPNDLAAATTR